MQPRVSWWDLVYHSIQDLFMMRHVLPAASMALIIVVIVGVALFYGPFRSGTGQSPVEGIAADNGEVLNQAVDNYHAVQDGKLALQLSSSEPAAIKAFFKNKVNFDVDVHQLRTAKLVGAVYSEYRGAKLAHIVYRSGDKIIYVYQVLMKDVGNGSGLQARHEIRDAIANNDVFMDSITNPPHHCCTVVWEERGVLCSAVSPMSKNEMFVTLQDQLDPDPR